VLIVSGVAYYFSAGLTGIPSSVTVSGRVSANGTATSPGSLIFTNENTGRAYDAAVVNGQYSVSLPSQQSYTVAIQ
jgi:phage baseplate assembly protein gpV